MGHQRCEDWIINSLTSLMETRGAQRFHTCRPNSRYRIESADGWYDDGVIAICAWGRDLEQLWTKDGADEHREIFELIGVPLERRAEGTLCHFTEQTARAFQLCHVLLHELGHHMDRMATTSERACPRGEPFAEAYAVRRSSIVWDRYSDVFRHLS